MRTAVALIGVSVLLTRCGPAGPTEMQQRVCDMYAETGIGPEKKLDTLVAYYERAKRLSEGKRGIQDGIDWGDGRFWETRTPQQMAERDFAAYEFADRQAREIVSRRLNLSRREVDDALALCLTSSVDAHPKRTGDQK